MIDPDEIGRVVGHLETGLKAAATPEAKVGVAIETLTALLDLIRDDFVRNGVIRSRPARRYLVVGPRTVDDFDSLLGATRCAEELAAQGVAALDLRVIDLQKFPDGDSC